MYYLHSRYYDPETCRFINADKFAATGQGILGANMFAYCGNDPVVCCDPDGDARVLLWYFLFLYSEFGYIHLQVQLHILATHPNTYLMEVGVNKADGKYGRADIFCPGTGEVWEVKSRGCAGLALGQAKGYVGGTTCVTEQKVSELGKAGAFSGSFVINYLDQSYEVVYSTPEPGVIIYDVSTRPQFEPEPDVVYYPRKKKASPATNTIMQYFECGGVVAGVVMVALTMYSLIRDQPSNALA